jgi:hypothetical protein
MGSATPAGSRQPDVDNPERSVPDAPLQILVDGVMFVEPGLELGFEGRQVVEILGEGAATCGS